MDLVGTCPMTEWSEWLEEGDCAGTAATGQIYGWYTRHSRAGLIDVGDRFYVVAHGKLRGWAPVVEVRSNIGIDGRREFVIERAGGAVACTLPERVPGFRGLRTRWWNYTEEIAFPDWKVP